MWILRIKGAVGEQTSFQIVREGRHGIVVWHEGEHVALTLDFILQNGEDFRIEALQFAQ